MYKYYIALKNGALKVNEPFIGDKDMRDHVPCHQISFQNGKPLMMRKNLKKLEPELLEVLATHPDLELVEIKKSDKEGLEKVTVKSGKRRGTEYYRDIEKIRSEEEDEADSKYVLYVGKAPKPSPPPELPKPKHIFKGGFSTKDEKVMGDLFEEAKENMGVKGITEEERDKLRAEKPKKKGRPKGKRGKK